MTEKVGRFLPTFFFTLPPYRPASIEGSTSTGIGITPLFLPQCGCRVRQSIGQGHREGGAFETKLAIKHLLKVQNGECPKALFREDIGFIDIVWGKNDPKTNKGYGLKHIVEKHGQNIKELGFEVEDFIPIVVQFGNLSVKKSDDKKMILESDTFRIVIQTRWDNQIKIFLLTAFDLRKKPE